MTGFVRSTSAPTTRMQSAFKIPSISGSTSGIAPPLVYCGCPMNQPVFFTVQSIDCFTFLCTGDQFLGTCRLFHSHAGSGETAATVASSANFSRSCQCFIQCTFHQLAFSISIIGYLIRTRDSFICSNRPMRHAARGPVRSGVSIRTRLPSLIDTFISQPISQPWHIAFAVWQSTALPLKILLY